MMPFTEAPVDTQYVHRALAKTHDNYTKRNPKSLAAHLAAHSSLPGGNTRTVLHAAPFPLTWKYGQDARLVSLDGHGYIDLLGEYSAGIFGHSDARIVHAVKIALLSGWNFGGNTMAEKKFARIVCERFNPSGIDLVRFTTSGTEANTISLAAAVALTGRKKILVFSGGHHGSTLVFPLALMKGSNAPTMNLPHEFVHAPYNNIGETKKIVDQISEKSALAAILVEPVQGSGGCRPATQEFMLYLRQLADETGAILVIDEVITSRLGVSGCSATMGVRGDFVTLGKYIGGGMTFGAFGGRKDLMEKFDPSREILSHAGTYNNNIVSMNAGIAALEIFDASEVSRLNHLGKKLKRAIQKLFIEQGLYPKSITDPSTDFIEIDSLDSEGIMKAGDDIISKPPMFITGRGSMLNVRFSGPDAAEWQSLFYHHNLMNGVNIAVRGYTPLNLCLSKDDLGKYVSVIKKFVLEHRSALLGDSN